MRKEDYKNQEVLKILKQISKGEIDYCEAYELIESHLL